MCLPLEEGGIFGIHTGSKRNSNGPKEGPNYPGLACTLASQRHIGLHWVCKFLSMFHQRILGVNYSTYPANKKEKAMKLVFSVSIIL